MAESEARVPSEVELRHWARIEELLEKIADEVEDTNFIMHQLKSDFENREPPN